MPPNIKSWLRRKALALGPGLGEKFLDMLKHLNNLSPDPSAIRRRSTSDGDLSSDMESIDGVMSDGSNGPLISPSHIPAYGRPPPSNGKWSEERWKDHVLVEYFAGWATAHATFHRRFAAVSTFPDKAYSKWGHIDVMVPEKFIQSQGIERDPTTGTSDV